MGMLMEGSAASVGDESSGQPADFLGLTEMNRQKQFRAKRRTP